MLHLKPDCMWLILCTLLYLLCALCISICEPGYSKTYTITFASIEYLDQDQDQDQDSLLVKRRNDNHSPGPVIRELVPSSHQRSELSNTILCIFSG